MEDFPSFDEAMDTVSRMRAREEKEQCVFPSLVDPEKAAHCQCEHCPPRSAQEPGDYCCSSLFSLTPTPNGILLRDGLNSKLEELGRHSCITLDPLFTNHIMSETAARLAADFYSLDTGVPITDKNRSYRYGVYRSFVATILGHLGQGKRIRLPSCFVKAVRSKWPSPSYSGFTESMPTYICVGCSKRCEHTRMHQFTTKDHLRDQWLTALTKDDATKARLDIFLRNSPGRNYVCADHFPDEAYTETQTSRVLKPTAVPISIRGSPGYRTPTPSYSPPPTPFVAPLLSSSIPIARTPSARPVVDRPLPVLRLADARPPRFCKRETPAEMKKDPDWNPPVPTIKGLPASKYFIVSKASLVPLLQSCNSCKTGLNSLEFSEKAHALSCTCTCTSCGNVFNWANSEVMHTANASSKEQLKEVNVDICIGSAVTAVGTARLNYFLKAVGLNQVATTTFHRHKNDYLLPAVTQVFAKTQEGVFERLKERLNKGEKLHVAGDGSFDTRGYSAEWCRYFLVDANTGEALVYVLMNKKETGNSGTLEVHCLDKALSILADKIGGVQHISTLVTDRHSGAIKMVMSKYPSIDHYFDPWHFFRNLTLNLLKIVKPLYMAQVKRTWLRITINKAYDAVVRAQGNGILASEMFRSALLCCGGVHDFSSDPSFTLFKKCLHPTPRPTFPYVPKDGKAYKRLETVIFTERNIQDIKNVSWLLKTSTCESLNAIAWKYAPKEMYFDRNGHELRTMMAMLHWNELKKDEMDGTRVIVGRKSHYSNTLKKHVYRNVKSPARNEWRERVKAKCYEIRASLTATPWSTHKKEKAAEKQQKQAHWNQLNTPSVPHPSDTNLEESEDEDEMPCPSAVEGERVDAISEEIRLLLEEDDMGDPENEFPIFF